MDKITSHDEFKSQCNQRMGSSLGEEFTALRSELIWIHAKWKEYLLLFADSPERIDLLTKVAGPFFAMLQQTLFEDIVLQLARLTDHRKTCGKDNLTINRLTCLVSDQQCKTEMEKLVASANATCEFARSWRHRRLAHNDLKLLLKIPTDPLPGISRADVEQALEAFRALLNRIQGYFLKTETAYKYNITIGGDATSLIHYLQKGIEAEVAQQR